MSQQSAPTTEDLLEKVKMALCTSAQALRNLSPDYARIGWMIEDIITYLEELEQTEETGYIPELKADTSDFEEQAKTGTTEVPR